MSAAVELPTLPTPREFQREIAKRRILVRACAVQHRVLVEIAPQTAVYLGCRKWFRLAAVREDFRHARRLTLGERIRFELVRRLRGGVVA